ncbi:23S rRNA pseudouridine(955/2504/2580) synthase, partial [Francisella tularensis subsp. holarctica]|nr:23S rRNA pseudouridine(955/2504/2580) synthase [Francisella tularensis subsp. holarctica]
DGKQALTRIRSVRHLQGGFSLLERKLETGRTHHIRVHTKAMGHPIVADKKYGFATNDQLLLEKGYDRLLFHAAKLEFYDYKQNKQI